MRLSFLVLLAGFAAFGLAGCGAPGAAADSANASAIRIADAALDTGNPTVALNAVGRVLATDPNDTGALMRQGRANAMLGQSAAAERSLRRVLSLEPRNQPARLALGKVILSTDPAQAESLFTEFLARDPSNTAALNDLGVARDMQAHHAQAQEAYRKALAISPDLASARQNLGLSLAISGKADEGATLIGQVVKDGNADRRARDNLALALAVSGHTGEADKMLREELSPRDATAALAGYRAVSAGAPAAQAIP
jgi:Flp pilus assembly protein TadD